MKLLSTILVLIIAAGCSKEKEPSVSELRSAIESFNEAYVRGDTSILAQMISDQYVHTNNSWRSFGKDQWLGYMRSRREKLDEGTLVVAAYEMDEYAVEQFGNSAIVTARISSKGTENGAPFDKSFRVTNVWVYNQGVWKRAAFHDTPIQ